MSRLFPTIGRDPDLYINTSFFYFILLDIGYIMFDLVV